MPLSFLKIFTFFVCSEVEREGVNFKEYEVVQDGGKRSLCLISKACNCLLAVIF